MPQIDIRRAKITDIGPVAVNAREIDVLEAEAVGMTMRKALRHGLLHGDAWTITSDGERVMMFGVVDTSIAEGRGRVWAVATKAAEAQWRQLLRVGEGVLSTLANRYMTLENYVHADNAKAIRWLRWSGFEVGEAEQVRGHSLRKITLCVPQLSL